MASDSTPLDFVRPQLREWVCVGQIILLENLRFHAEEEGSSKDAEGKKVKADAAAVKEFRKGLTALGDVFISMCFSAINSLCSRTNGDQTMLSELLTEPTAPWSE